MGTAMDSARGEVALDGLAHLAEDLPRPPTSTVTAAPVARVRLGDRGHPPRRTGVCRPRRRPAAERPGRPSRPRCAAAAASPATSTRRLGRRRPSAASSSVSRAPAAATAAAVDVTVVARDQQDEVGRAGPELLVEHRRRRSTRRRGRRTRRCSRSNTPPPSTPASTTNRPVRARTSRRRRTVNWPMRVNMLRVYACTSTLVNVKAVTRERNPRGQGDRLRADLLDATVDLIAEAGSVDGVSLRAAAKRAGVSPMAVYNHFEDRDALLEAAVEHCWEEFQGTLAAALDDPDPSARLARRGRRLRPLRPRSSRPVRRHVLGHREPPRAARGHRHGRLRRPGGDGGRDPRRQRRPARPHLRRPQVHTWIHGIVTLVACAPGMAWPSMDDLLDDLVIRLGLTAPP